MSFHPDNKLKANWRPIAAVIYLCICLFDFVVMPVVYANTIDYVSVFEQLDKMTSEKAKVALIDKLDFDRQSWEPATLGGGGMFHLAFGALLTGAAVTRGLEKKAFREQQGPL